MTKSPIDLFKETIAALRHPVTGCPWDLEQSHDSLRKYMIEEAYEAVEVMSPCDDLKLKEELGDVLLQVVLNAQIASERGAFNFDDVVKGIDDKMRNRHPHVFDQVEDSLKKEKLTPDHVRFNWEQQKKIERNQNQDKTPVGFFSGLAPHKTTPAMQLSVAIGKRSKEISFDWSTPHEVMGQLKSEMTELDDELNAPSMNPSSIYEELGDVFFTLANLARHLKIDPEVCTYDANAKFLRRFKKMEELARDEGVDLQSKSQAELELYWKRAKELEMKSKTPSR